MVLAVEEGGGGKRWRKKKEVEEGLTATSTDRNQYRLTEEAFSDLPGRLTGEAVSD
jgi:hypothetical protein